MSRKVVHAVEIDGVSVPLREACGDLGICYDSAKYRLVNGLDWRTPIQVNKKHEKHDFHGQRLTLLEISKRLDMTLEGVQKRLRKGQKPTVQEAFAPAYCRYRRADAIQGKPSILSGWGGI